MVRRSTGASYTAVSDSIIKKYNIPLPLLEEQRRIAAILDKADAVRRKRQQASALTEELLRSAFLEMFGDSSSMEKLKLEELAANRKHALSSGPFGSSLTSAHYVEEGILVLRGKNVTEGQLNLSDCKYVTEEKATSLARSAVTPGDVVVVAVGASGMAFPIPDGFPQAIMSQNFNKISPDPTKVDSIYLAYAINSTFVQRQLAQNITDTVRTFLSLTKLREILIPLPELRLQHTFSSLFKQLEAIQREYVEAVETADDLFNTLLQKAFRGEL